jgi:octaprenyl-diphosphate synthase
LSVAVTRQAPYWTSVIDLELKQVETVLRGIVQSEVGAAKGMSLRLFGAGGKRLRPALVILCARALDPECSSDRAVGLAAAVELVHAASLMHDDVVDDSATRRGIPTANAVFGNRVSVLGGDYMLSRALTLLGIHGDMWMLREVAAVGTSMAESEVLQAMCVGDIDLWAANYMGIIEGKTAGFMATCCRLGVRLSKARAKPLGHLSDFGRHVGIAFQVTDDILDVTGDPRDIGKGVCNDLLNGKFTMPVLAALACGDPGVRERLHAILQPGIRDEAQAREAADILVQCGAVESAREMARQHVALAIDCLSSLPQNQYTKALRDLASRIIDRAS